MPKKCPVPDGIVVGAIYKIKGHNGTLKYKVTGVRAAPREPMVSFEPVDEGGEPGEISLSMFKTLAEIAWENDEESGRLLEALSERMKSMGWPVALRSELWQLECNALARGFACTDVDPFSNEFATDVSQMPVAQLSQGEEDGN